MISRIFLIFFATVILLLSSCITGDVLDPTPGPTLPTPTTHQLFTGSNSVGEMYIDIASFDIDAHPTLASYFLEDTNPYQPKMTATPENGSEKPASETASEQWVKVVIFDEELNQNWDLNYRGGVESDLVNSAVAYNGDKALEVDFSEGASKLIFAVDDDTTESYLRNLVEGVSFRLYSEENYIGNDDLSVTVLGSNKYIYWKSDDGSVENIYEPLFSQTRLYFLNFNRSIPPGTWVEVIVWLDDLIYDPDYNYVTGMYILSDELYSGTILIDNVELIMKELGPSLRAALPTQVSPSPTIETLPLLEETPVPTSVPPTPTPPSIIGETLVNANCREGPGTDYPITISYRKGQQVNIQGRNSTSDWYLVDGSIEATSCWIFTGLINLDLEPIELPVIHDDPESARLHEVPEDTES